CQNVPYFRHLIETALQRIGLDPRSINSVLDIGSGAGNSVLPILELCPHAFVVASDLSIELLALLKGAIEEQGHIERCALVQLNAEDLDFHAESFDLVVGAAILHHLFAPDETIRRCGTILKRGGFALFFEPFETGNLVLRMIYHSILNEAR